MALVKGSASSLETVLAALRSEGDRNGGSLLFISPPWSKSEERQQANAEEVGLERVTFSGESLQIKLQNEEKLLSELQAHLDSSSTAGKVLTLLKTYLQGLPYSNLKCSDHTGYSRVASNTVIHDPIFKNLLKSRCGAISRRLVTAILRWCVKTETWEPVYVLLDCGVVSANEYPELIYRIVELGNIPLICLCVFRVRDMRPSQWLEILKLFLANPSKLGKMFETQKQIWHAMITSYMSNASQKLKQGAAEDDEAAMLRAGCIKLAAAYDGFSAQELCLHLFVAAGQDEAVLSAVILELNNAEVMGLLRYLNKWLEKYSSRLILVRKMKREERKLVPSLEAVMRCVGIVLEGRYASFVLGERLSEELGVTRGVVNKLVMEGKKAASLEGVVQHLIGHKALPSEKLGAHVSEHIIEYLQLS